MEQPTSSQLPTIVAEPVHPSNSVTSFTTGQQISTIDYPDQQSINYRDDDYANALALFK